MREFTRKKSNKYERSNECLRVYNYSYDKDSLMLFPKQNVRKKREEGVY